MVILEPNGELRDASNLELLGTWFKVDEVYYYIKTT